MSTSEIGIQRSAHLTEEEHEECAWTHTFTAVSWGREATAVAWYACTVSSVHCCQNQNHLTRTAAIPFVAIQRIWEFTGTESVPNGMTELKVYPHAITCLHPAN